MRITFVTAKKHDIISVVIPVIKGLNLNDVTYREPHRDSEVEDEEYDEGDGVGKNDLSSGTLDVNINDVNTKEKIISAVKQKLGNKLLSVLEDGVKIKENKSYDLFRTYL